MTATITIRVREIDGEPVLDAAAVELLFGVEQAAFTALPLIDGRVRLPREWVRRGKRRAREAMAHTGSDTMTDCLRYWARKDHNAELQVVYR
ncbi:MULTISPECIES: hypothetical protein [Mycobacterium]|uniref:hypothetical protein n=1 Tax=Mycobacterium TaxID=1763 RepID=UPI001EF095CC|nr:MULTISPECIES: hypothetical protein [Mycobacterium]BDB44554.1 hypothetical protein IWGMT90018_50000 [Mycobacterium kiyosense]BDE16060.1 hypothetical protein MKCMC460_49200 [Mycobacterium sp. 20KCMC460]GLB93044.1 hypothetical protein SRL2020130_58610 [Mycobacterium kiyosense]GLC04841.1 hypothetical protein SRL2020400_54320 [Mycobacterium kiyosense]GLC11243.1 hypothetical protein SRL2020411_58890 [Mycobacterium kiyosense]